MAEDILMIGVLVSIVAEVPCDVGVYAAVAVASADCGVCVLAEVVGS